MGEEELIQENETRGTQESIVEKVQEPITVKEGVFSGIPASPGIAIGAVFQFKRADLVIEEKSSGRKEEKKRLQDAIKNCKVAVKALK